VIGDIADVVVGLGSAGSCPAATAATHGARVIAIEARREAGAPVQCAEFIPALLNQELPFLGAVTVQPITRMRSFVEGEAPDVTDNFPGRMIARAAFDRQLARRAAAAWLDGNTRALDHYEDDFAELFDAALTRALAKRAALRAFPAAHGPPNATALRPGWIGYPQYWVDTVPPELRRSGRTASAPVTRD